MKVGLKKKPDWATSTEIKKGGLDFLLEAVKQAANPVLLLYHATWGLDLKIERRIAYSQMSFDPIFQYS